MYVSDVETSIEFRTLKQPDTLHALLLAMPCSPLSVPRVFVTPHYYPITVTFRRRELEANFTCGSSLHLSVFTSQTNRCRVSLTRDAQAFHTHIRAVSVPLFLT